MSNPDVRGRTEILKVHARNKKISPKINFEDIFNRASGQKGYLFLNIDKTRFVINYYSLNRVGWNLVSIIPYKDAIKEIDGLKKRIFSLNIFVSLFLFAVAVVFIILITNPLNKLVERIKTMKIGEHHIEWHEENFSDDVSGIVRSFDYMFEKIEELVNVVIEEKRRENELKYEALQAQITPHFLFNTLNTIKWSAIMSGAGNVAKMISALGRLLEVSMSKGEEEVAFNEEIELIESYVFIQNVRYNDKYLLNIDVAESIYSLKVPKLILQPLVENAIIHGLKNIEGKGIITIRAIENDGCLKVSVADNGEGISENKIQKILKNSNGERKQRFSGIGLANINERLKLRYGQGYGISISSKIGYGTTVDLVLPIVV
jgi:sensor histidine kinase YesM